MYISSRTKQIYLCSYKQALKESTEAHAGVAMSVHSHTCANNHIQHQLIAGSVPLMQDNRELTSRSSLFEEGCLRSHCLPKFLSHTHTSLGICVFIS